MTCELSMAFEQGALLATDTLTVASVGPQMVQTKRIHKSKLVRDPNRQRWLSPGGCEELSEFVLPRILEDAPVESLPAEVDAWVRECGLGKNLSTVKLSDHERSMLGSPFHSIEVTEDKAFRAVGIDPAKGLRHVFPAGSGVWFSLPFGAEEKIIEPWLQSFLDEQVLARNRYAGTPAVLGGILRAVAHLFATMESRYGGEDGWMDDQLELGLFWRATSGAIITLHRAPGRAARLMAATDREVLDSLLGDAGESATTVLFPPVVVGDGR